MLTEKIRVFLSFLNLLPCLVGVLGKSGHPVVSEVEADLDHVVDLEVEVLKREIHGQEVGQEVNILKREIRQEKEVAVEELNLSPQSKYAVLKNHVNIQRYILAEN